jgi:hypothetical protein
MFVSVTENASSVTDVMALLSNAGYDSRHRDRGLTLVIDKFDSWTNPANGSLGTSTIFTNFDAA